MLVLATTLVVAMVLEVVQVLEHSRMEVVAMAQEQGQVLATKLAEVELSTEVAMLALEQPKSVCIRIVH